MLIFYICGSQSLLFKLFNDELALPHDKKSGA